MLGVSVRDIFLRKVSVICLVFLLVSSVHITSIYAVEKDIPANSDQSRRVDKALGIIDSIYSGLGVGADIRNLWGQQNEQLGLKSLRVSDSQTTWGVVEPYRPRTAGASLRGDIVLKEALVLADDVPTQIRLAVTLIHESIHSHSQTSQEGNCRILVQADHDFANGGKKWTEIEAFLQELDFLLRWKQKIKADNPADRDAWLAELDNQINSAVGLVDVYGRANYEVSLRKQFDIQNDDNVRLELIQARMGEVGPAMDALRKEFKDNIEETAIGQIGGLVTKYCSMMKDSKQIFSFGVVGEILPANTNVKILKMKDEWYSPYLKEGKKLAGGVFYIEPDGWWFNDKYADGKPLPTAFAQIFVGTEISTTLVRQQSLFVKSLFSLSESDSDLLGWETLSNCSYDLASQTITAAILGTSMIAATSGDSWSMFHHDPARIGYSTSLAPNMNNTLWKYTRGAFLSSPAVADGKLFIGSLDNNIYCLDSMTGAFIWNYTTAAAVWSSPAYANGVVFVGSEDKNVYALNATTGTKIWNFATTIRIVRSSPAVADGKVFIGSYQRLYCLNASTGTLIWNNTLTGWNLVDEYATPSVADGNVFINGYYGVFCFNENTGANVWSYIIMPGFSHFYSSPTVINGKVFVNVLNDTTFPVLYTLYALNETSGTLVWKSNIGASNYLLRYSSAAAIYGGMVFVGSADGRIYAINEENGTPAWNFSTGDCVISSPALADNKIFIGSTDKKLYCLNQTTGALIWSYETGLGIYSSPAVADGMVFVGSQDGKVYAFGAPILSVSISPSSATLDFGQSQLFTSTVSSGTSPYTYQWYLNDVAVSGATSSTWTFTPSSSGSYNVYVNVTDSVGFRAKSNITSVTVNPSLSATVSPSSVVMDFGQSQLFTSTVSSGTSPYTYQWYLNDVAVSGATSSTWTFTPSSSGSYNVYVNVTDSVGFRAKSNITSVTVNPSLSATVSPSSVVMDFGQSQLFTSTVSGGTSPYTYQWYLNGAIVSGATNPTWTFTPASAGSYTVYVKVNDSVGAQATSNTATVTVNIPGTHDVAVTNVTSSKTAVGQGFSASINVTVANQGSYTEAFNVTVYYGTGTLTPEQWNVFWSMGDCNRDGYINQTDIDIIGANFGWHGPLGANPADVNSDGIVNLNDIVICGLHQAYEIWNYFLSGGTIGTTAVTGTPSGSSTLLTFEWNTTGVAHGDYIISAYASPVPGETDTSDNNFAGGRIVVSMIGDLTGGTPSPWDFVPDGKVGGVDVSVVSRCFGSSPETVPPIRWEPNCDINNNGRVDGNDIAFTARHFGEADP